MWTMVLPHEYAYHPLVAFLLQQEQRKLRVKKKEHVMVHFEQSQQTANLQKKAPGTSFVSGAELCKPPEHRNTIRHIIIARIVCFENHIPIKARNNTQNYTCTTHKYFFRDRGRVPNDFEGFREILSFVGLVECGP